LLLSISNAYAQNIPDNHIIDSLENFLSFVHEDSKKVLIYNDLAFRLRNDQLEKAEDYALKALEIAQKKKLSTSQARSYELLGLLKFRKGFYDLAIEYHFKALNLHETLGLKRGIAWANNNIANVYFEQGNYESSLNYYKKALIIQEEIKDTVGIANTFKNMGWLFVKTKETQKGFAVLRLALFFAKKMKDFRIMSHIYNSLGDACGQTKQYDSALYFLDKALQIHQKENNGYDLTHTFNSIGEMYVLQKKLPQAEKYYHLALKLSTKLGIRYEKQVAYLGISTIYQTQNNFPKALQYYQKYDSLKDSLLNQNSADKIAHLHAEFDLEKKQEHILLLQKETELKDEKLKEKNILISSAIVLVVLVLFLVVILWSAMKHRQKTNKLLHIKNIDLHHKNKEISQQKEELTATNETLTKTLAQVALQQQELLERNEEILVQQEELTSQNDSLMLLNQQIIEQKSVIEILNNSLEVKIESRTEELQDALDKLVSQNADLEQFAYIVSHNLKAPVAHILGLTSLLQFSDIEISEENEIHKRVREAAKNLEIILADLNHILDVKNNASKKQSVVILNEIITEVLQKIAEDIQNTATIISTDLTVDSQFIAIHEYIYNIVFQLLSNAIKFRDTNRSLEINIKTFTTDTHLVLAIKDNGLGMYDTANLFRLYHKQHENLSGKALGLFMVKVQVDVLGGQIEVQSCIGEGTMFKVYFTKK
jgi:signal transduction histidine kinase